MILSINRQTAAFCIECNFSSCLSSFLDLIVSLVSFEEEGGGNWRKIRRLTEGYALILLFCCFSFLVGFFILGG